MIEVQSDSELKDLKKNSKKLFLFIYKEGCPYCKRVEPLFEKIDRENTNSSIVYAKLNKDKTYKNSKGEVKYIRDSVSKEHGFDNNGELKDSIGKVLRKLTYPLFLYYKDGAARDVFIGDSSEKDRIIEFLKPVVQLKTIDSFNSFTKSGIKTILLYADWCGYCQIAKPIYTEVCDTATCAKINIDSKVLINYVKDLLYKNKLLEKNSGLAVPTYIQFTIENKIILFTDDYRDKTKLKKFIKGK